MKRASKGYSRVDTPLFQTMLVQDQALQGEGPTTPVESHPTPTSPPSTSQQPSSPPSMVKKLEQTIKTSQAKRRAKVVISDTEEDEEDPSKQGRSLIEEIDIDTGISLVPPHVADQGRFDDTQVSDQPEDQLGVFSAAKVLADAA
ncbi:hypothetical protein Tco_0540615 [Tanacetum coccineum]